MTAMDVLEVLARHDVIAATSVKRLELLWRLDRVQLRRRARGVAFREPQNAREQRQTRVIGTPDLAIEIFSPGGASRDRNSKRRRYEAAGTPELWLVDPVRHFVHRYVHDGTAFGPPTEHRGKIRLHILPKVEIDLRQVW